MKKVLVYLMLLSSTVGVSQNPEDKPLRVGKDSIDFNLLNRLVELKINKIRKDNSLDTLLVRNDMREGALRNTNNCYKLKETGCIHSEKGNFGEITMMSSTWTYVTINEIAEYMVKGWMKSPPHKSIILNKNIKYFGTACFVKSKMEWEDLGSLQEPSKMGYVKRYYMWGTVRFI